MGFNRRSTAEQVTEGLDLTGKNIVITGINSGLGFETMRVLTMRGAHVFALARSMEKAQEACAKVGGTTTPLACELSDWQSVKDCADAIKATQKPIDGFIANAGIMAPNELTLYHGLESQFATNHMGHFILVHNLLDQIKQAENGRIAFLSSDAHDLFSPKGGIAFDNLDASKGYKPWVFYGQAKMANLLASKAFAKRLKGTNATANALHPGVVKTGLGRGAGFMNTFLYFISMPIHKTIPQGAATSCYVITHPDAAGINGEYLSNFKPIKPNKMANDEALVDRLWSVSEELAADYI